MPSGPTAIASSPITITNMPDLAISAGVRRTSRTSIRPSLLYNMRLTKDEEAPDGFARVSRHGLGEYATLGSGPINGLFARKGVFSEALFAISSSAFYRASTSLGTIPGGGPASFAAAATEVLVTRGATPYSYNGTDFVDAGVLDADDNPYSVRAVAFLGGYFIAVRDGTNRFYWSASQDGRTWDGLDFASAESSPDELLDVYVVNDGLWFMGAETVEFWQLTGSDPPFARVEGFLLKKGITATGCAAEADNTLFWWGHDNRIYRAAQGAPQGVSDESIEPVLKAATLRDMFSYSYEGGVYVVVRTDSGTFELDVGKGVWSEHGTTDRGVWRTACAAMVGEAPVFGDDTGGTLWEYDPNNWDDGDYMERKLSASFNYPGGTVTGHRLCILGNPGDTPLLTGQGTEPVISMRGSRDNAKTFGVWRDSSLGAQGKYRQRIEWRRLGLYDTAGGYFEFRVTDPVPVRISRIYANEPGGGRANRSG